MSSAEDLEARLLKLRMPSPPPPPDPKDQEIEDRLLALRLPNVPTHPIEDLEVTLARLDRQARKGKRGGVRVGKPYKCKYCSKKFFTERRMVEHVDDRKCKTYKK